MACRIMIDRVRCENNGYCSRVAGGLIRLDSEGSPQVIVATLDAMDEALARAAVDACPMGALSLAEDAAQHR